MKTSLPRQKRLILLSFCASILFHILVLSMLKMFGNYEFVVPVNINQTVMVDLGTKQVSPTHAPTSKEKQITSKATNGSPSPSPSPPPPTSPPVPQPVIEEFKSPAVDSQRLTQPGPATLQAPIPPVEKTEPRTFVSASNHTHSATTRRDTQAIEITPPLRTASEFLGSANEKLAYLISFLGMPVGNAELEAKNEKGEVRITLRVNTNAAMASLYPVNDLIETRHIAGNFVITKIMQQEGDFRSDIGFTIFLRDKSVFWIDRIRNRSSREMMPNNEVLDTLSGFYFLRNKELQVGKTETLHIYDSEKYVPVPIEVVRKEKILLPNLSKVETLVIRPIRENNGTFSRTKDMLIWLTDDEKKVPVKVETSAPFGRVTAELISAESKP